MAVTVKFLSARRFYDFRQDDIRLTLLGTGAVMEHIRQHFGFQGAQVTSPQGISGSAPPVFPPGLVFTLGIAPYPDRGATAIRFLSIEPRRIVIDVEGPSNVLDPTFGDLRRLVQDLRTLDGSPAIAEPTHVVDYSEFTVELPYPPDAILPPRLRSLAGSILGVSADDGQPGGRAIVPLLQIRALPGDAEYLGSAAPSDRWFQFELRAGTTPDDRLYYSAATLDTDAHARLLEGISEVMASQQP